MNKCIAKVIGVRPGGNFALLLASDDSRFTYSICDTLYAETYFNEIGKVAGSWWYMVRDPARSRTFMHGWRRLEASDYMELTWK